MAGCAECGASGRLGRCSDLFDVLLALDHGRLQPWGEFHGVNVACFLLQHPSRTSASVTGGQWQLVTRFLSGGVEAANELAAEQVRLNRESKDPWTAADPPPDRSSESKVTIEDVSVDGTFPASGYEPRMYAWAESVVAERTIR